MPTLISVPVATYRRVPIKIESVGVRNRGHAFPEPPDIGANGTASTKEKGGAVNEVSKETDQEEVCSDNTTTPV